jgi:hypothetical protein
MRRARVEGRGGWGRSPKGAAPRHLAAPGGFAGGAGSTPATHRAPSECEALYLLARRSPVVR